MIENPAARRLTERILELEKECTGLENQLAAARHTANDLQRELESEQEKNKLPLIFCNGCERTVFQIRLANDGLKFLCSYCGSATKLSMRIEASHA